MIRRLHLVALALVVGLALCACRPVRGAGQAPGAEPALGLEQAPAGWASLKGDKERARAFAQAERYLAFIDKARTVRRTVTEAEAMAAAAGFAPLTLSGDARLEVGQKVSLTMRGKVFAAVSVGPADAPFRVIITTIDAPRIDIKQKPLYANSDVVLFDTHFYGAVDKKQWLSVPLALYGDWVEGGELRSMALGDDPDEPVSAIPDLLPHLARKIQRERVVSGEQLDAVAGFAPLGGEPPAPPEDPGPTRAPEAFLKALTEATGLTEEHFQTGEFQLAPAASPHFIGVDRGMIAAYGHHFRSVLFAGLEGLSQATPAATTILIALDKGELSRTGNTGQAVVRDILGEIHFRLAPEDQRTELGLRRRLHGSRGWVTAGVGGSLGAGVVFNARRDDALPGLLRWTFDALDAHKVPYQLNSSGGWGSPSRSLATQGIDFMDFAIPIAGHGTPSEVITVPDLNATASMIRAIAQAP